MTLIQTFKPEDGESPLGYYRRLTRENRYFRWQDLAAAAGVSRTRSGIFGQPEHVARTLGLDAAWTASLQARDRQLQSFGRLRRGQFDAVCTICLGESMYIRACWEHAFVTACPKHRVRLIDRCDRCGRALSIKRQAIETCSCGRDLRDVPTAPAPEYEVWLSAMLAGAPRRTKQLPIIKGAVEPEHLGQLIATLCQLYDVQKGDIRRNAAPPRSVAEAVEFLQPLARLLLEWPTQYREHIADRLRNRSPQARTLNGALGSWYQRLKHCCADGSLHPFLDHVSDVASSEFPGVLGLDAAGGGPKSSEYMTLKEASRRIGVSRDRLINAIEAGTVKGSTRRFGERRLAHYVRRSEVDLIVAQRGGWIEHDAACELLQVPTAVMGSLIRSGLVTEDRRWRSDLRKGGPVSLVSVQALEQDLRSFPPADQGAGAVVEVRHLTSRRLGEKGAIEAALRAIGTGRIQPTGVVPDQPIGRFAYRLSDVRQFFGAPILESGLSLRQLSDLTGWKYESVCHWIGEGFLEAETIMLRGQSCRVVTPAQMLSFSRTYMPLTDVAKLVDSRPSAVARRLEGVEVVGAKPLPSGARRGGLVRLVDLISGVLALRPQQATEAKTASSIPDPQMATTSRINGRNCPSQCTDMEPKRRVGPGRPNGCVDFQTSRGVARG